MSWESWPTLSRWRGPPARNDDAELSLAASLDATSADSSAASVSVVGTDCEEQPQVAGTVDEFYYLQVQSAGVQTEPAPCVKLKDTPAISDMVVQTDISVETGYHCHVVYPTSEASDLAPLLAMHCLARHAQCRSAVEGLLGGQVGEQRPVDPASAACRTPALARPPTRRTLTTPWTAWRRPSCESRCFCAGWTTLASVAYAAKTSRRGPRSCRALALSKLVKL